MQSYISFIDRFKWLFAFGVPLIVFMLASNLKHLEMDGSYRIWFAESSKTLADYDNFRATFGNDDAVTILLKNEKGVFNKKTLQSIDNITQALWQMKYIARVDSITNYQYVHAGVDNPDDIIVEDFIQDIQKRDKNYFNNRKNIAINDPLLVDGFISKDGTTTLITARLTPKVNDIEDKSIEIIQMVKAILKPEIQRTGYQYWINGGPAINSAFIELGTYDATTFTPLIILTAFIMLFLLFGRVSGALIPIGVVIFTFMIVLAVQVLLGYKLNNFTANLPVFVVAIGIADAVHIYGVWLLKKREGIVNYDAVLYSLEKNFLPILLTSITTAIGFATLTISHIIPIFTLGVATASGAILAFIISIVWMPSLLLLLKKDIKTTTSQNIQMRSSLGYGAFIVKNHKKIILFTSLVFGFLAIGLFKVKVDSNTIRYFDKSVNFRQSTEFMQNNLTGPMAYEIVVNSKTKNGIKDPKFLKTVKRFYADFSNTYKDVRHLSSLMDTVQRFNKVVNHQNVIPDDKNLIAQYLLLYSLSLPQGMEISDKMDINEQRLRITAQMNIVDTSLDLEMIKYVSTWWDKTPYSAEVLGQTKMFAHMQTDVTDTLIYSLSLALVLVSAVMLAVFRRFKLFWVFILPNVLPVVLVVGLMGWIGINIDIGVAIAGAIIIGVAVDDTIHFLVKYFDARKRGLSQADTFDEVLHYAGRAIIFTTVILSVAFALFAFSNFVPNQNFGIVTASALLIAMVVDLLLLPSLLSIADKENQI